MTAPNPYLSGNYAPILDEITATDLECVGAIPEALTGRYLRTGPNPMSTPREPHHWFLGDGMIHGIELRGGHATSYRNRWVRTDAIALALDESPVGGPKQPMFDSSNTNVVGFNGQILSLTEGCYPYVMSKELDTLKRFDGGTLPRGMTAHPKIDPRRNEMVGFSYGFVAPYLYFHVVDAQGTVTKTEPIDIERSVSMHDFAMTENYVLFFDQPYVFDLEVAKTQGFPFRWAPEFGARVGVMPRNGSNADVKWFETDTCYTFHPMNAFETSDGKIVVDVPKITNLGGEMAPSTERGSLERWTLDLVHQTMTADVVDPSGQEFCRINESLLGTEHRFGYTVSAFDDGPMPYDASTIFKHDFTSRTRVDHNFAEHCHPGEFVFVTDPDRASAEDGGWMMGLVTDEAENRTELVILDAQDFAGDPVATVKLPRRVPYGFHGNWISD